MSGRDDAGRGMPAPAEADAQDRRRWRALLWPLLVAGLLLLWAWEEFGIS